MTVHPYGAMLDGGYRMSSRHVKAGTSNRPLHGECPVGDGVLSPAVDVPQVLERPRSGLQMPRRFLGHDLVRTLVSHPVSDLEQAVERDV